MILAGIDEKGKSLYNVTAMKKDLHPKWYPAAKVFVNNEEVMTVGSTLPEIRVEIWSGNHPFYTGKQQLLDTTGNVDRFRQRVAKAAAAKADVKEKKPRKARTTKTAKS